MEPLDPKPKKMTFEEAQGLNRHARRTLGKQNGVRIPGTNVPLVKPKKPTNQYGK